MLPKPEKMPATTIVFPYWENSCISGERCVLMSVECCEALTWRLQAQKVTVEWRRDEHKGPFEHQERIESALKALHELTGIPYDPACEVLQALEAAVSMLRRFDA